VNSLVEIITKHLAGFLEIAAACIIAVAAISALVKYILYLTGKGPDDLQLIRLSLGRSFSLVLEFLLGADILKTAVAPSWNDIGQLAAIAVLRTGLNFFLEKELKESKKVVE
jgi:uncharacterized membrane protein